MVCVEVFERSAKIHFSVGGRRHHEVVVLDEVHIGAGKHDFSPDRESVSRYNGVEEVARKIGNRTQLISFSYPI